MMECGTCKWWTEGDDFAYLRDEDEGWRYQLNEDDEWIDVVGRWGHCKKVAQFGPRSQAERFYVIDGSTYYASLRTRIDFGCVEHEDSQQAEALENFKRVAVERERALRDQRGF